VLDLNGPAPDTSTLVAYSEGQTQTAIAPSTTVSDSDSPDFDGGTLVVEFTANGTDGDRLTIIDQGFGAGNIQVGEGVLRLTVSIGVSTFPAANVTSADDLFAHADAAMYRAKQDGRNQVRS
jgi:GGDEF domain-containing protein